MANQYDFLVFIGRFQPFHQGHYYVIEQALKQAKQVIILIGSANTPRTIKNPFSFDERAWVISQSFDHDKRLICLPIDDDLYNDDKWLKSIQNAVYSIAGDTPDHKIALIGHSKDASSYYLSLFPQWQFEQLPNFAGLSATPMRREYFLLGKLDKNLPKASSDFLVQFLVTDEYARLKNDYHHIITYRQAWQNAPYPPVFVTADALVVQAGHVLVVERGGDYGQGLLALAGGFLDQGESLLECAIRELFEETGLLIDKTTLKASQTFDMPERSLRGRTVTTVFHFELFGTTLPQVMGGDDANQAFWLPLGQLDGKKMFEDHYSIIKKMLGL